MLASMEEAVELSSLACSPWWRVACMAGGYRWATCNGACAALQLKSWGPGARPGVHWQRPLLCCAPRWPGWLVYCLHHATHACGRAVLFSWPMQHGQGTLLPPLAALLTCWICCPAKSMRPGRRCITAGAHGGLAFAAWRLSRRLGAASEVPEGVGLSTWISGRPGTLLEGEVHLWRREGAPRGAGRYMGLGFCIGGSLLWGPLTRG
jgi:hypothetical protein